MSTEEHQITVNGLVVDVVRQNIKNLHLAVYPPAGRVRILTSWYRRQLKAEIAPLITKWEPLIGVQVAEWGVKKMKTKWGTCTIEARRIWLNLELIKKPVHCLEYVVVHEMVHLLERHHNERFVTYMNGFLPQWQYYREELNQAPLGHASWEY